MDTIEKLKRISFLRTALAKDKEILAQLDAALHESRDYKHYMEEASMIQDQLNELTSEVRDDTLKAYAATGNKSPFPGMGIRVTTRLDYDSTKARDWALEHNHVNLLTVKAKEFEAMAKAVKPDFVTILEEPTTTMATDLDKALEKI